MNVDIIEKPKKNISEDIKVSSSTDVLNLKDVQEIRNAIREHLLFIGLDNRNNVRNITLLGIGTFVAYKTEFFIVDKIVYKGDSLITGEFIKTNVEEVKGSNIIVFNKDELIKKLMQNPYVATVTISKKLPKTLEVNVDEKKGIYYQKNGNSFDIISEDLHLLERTNSLDGKNLIEIKGLNTKDKEVGMKIEENTRLEKVLNLL